MSGFDNLRDKFREVADKIRQADVSGRVVRSLATGGKAAVDRGLQEFPQTLIKDLANEVYTAIASQEVADGISSVVRSFDEEKVKEILDGAVDSLKRDDVAQKLAKSIKDLLAKASSEDLENQLDAALNDRPLGQRMIIKMFFEQARPALDEMRNASEDEVAQRIKDLADQIPTSEIAMQVAAITGEVTPERVSAQTHDLVGKLPAPATLSKIVHGVGKLASDKLGDVSQAADAVDAARNALSSFASEAGQVVDKTLANDDQAKKTFKGRKGKSFDFGK